VPYASETLAAILLGLLALSIWDNYCRRKLIERCVELLAARSYGEFAAGKAKLEGKTTVPEEWDPNF
jgi:hypothetical protein